MTNASRCRKSKCFSVLVAAFFLQGAVFAARWNDVDIKSAPVVQVESVTVEGEAASLLPPGKKWKLVWNDEFNGPEIDKTKWMCRESFWGADFPAFAHNFEGVEMTGRTMKLHLLRKGDDFTSPHLQTGSLTYDIPKDSGGFWPFGRRRKPLFMHKYGYYEIRCRQPKCPGWHSAFWLQAPGIGSSSDPGVCGIETDIMENYRQHTEGKIVGGNGWGGYGRDSRWFGHFAWDYEEMEDGWCYYGVDWSPNGYTFYANGKKVGEQNSPVSHVEQFILVSTEPRGYRKVGNDGGLSEGRRVWGKPDPMLFEAVLPDFFEVDFVRVYDVEACSATGGELEMRNIAHRGMWDGNVPQNTVEAIKRAYDSGATWVETDFHHTKAGQMVCMHHEGELKKYTGCTKKVADLTPEDVATLNLGEKDNLPKVYRIPLLDQVLAVVPKHGVLQSEIKGYSPQYADIFDAAVKAAGLSETNIVVSSFQYDALKDFKSRYPKYRCVWLVGLPRNKPFVAQEYIDKCKAGGIEVFCPGCGSTKGVMIPSDADAIRAAGLEFRMYGVNSLKEMQQAKALGATGFTCNYWFKAFDWAREVGGVKLLK